MRPLLKKPTLDRDVLSSYRPIFNLSFVSKTIERLVDARLTTHINSQHLLSITQSAYRANHSTETALVKVHNDLIQMVDAGWVGGLVLLDLSAAFDTVNHSLMLDILRERFGITDTALQWFTSYFHNRSHTVLLQDDRSRVRYSTYGVPQGSVLGPKTFITYTEELSNIFSGYDLRHHSYADDVQMYGGAKPVNISTVWDELQRCAADVKAWCSSRGLQLNAAKTELMWFGTAGNLKKISDEITDVKILGHPIAPASDVRNLGVLFDSTLEFRNHVAKLAQTSFYILRRLRSIRGKISQEDATSLVVSLVFSRLDYCNSLLANLPAITLAPLQRVQNAAVRLVLDLKPTQHTSPGLRQLHWLPVTWRIKFKLCVLVYRAVHGSSPSYIMDLVIPSPNTSLRSCARGDLVVPRTKLRLGERAFGVAGPQEWNSLPPGIRTLPSIDLFKTELKTHFFKLAFPG